MSDPTQSLLSSSGIAHASALNASGAISTVPLIRNEHGVYVIGARVPEAMVLKAQGAVSSSTGDAALAQLAGLVGTVSSDAGLLENAKSFLQSLPAGTPLYAQLLTVTAQPGQVPSDPLQIFASTPGNDGVQAVVIDARALPAGSTVHIDNVDFVAVVGNVRLTGGQGPIHVSGDGAGQTMVLGVNDPMVWGGGVVHGGGGNDTVGGLMGSQRVFGDEGDDIVFGGGGDDILWGGAGNDRLDGGLGWDIAAQSGTLADYTWHKEGQVLVLTHRITGEVDRLKSVEVVKFDWPKGSGNVISDTDATLYVATSDAQAALAHITSRWLARDPTAGEGAWVQQNSHLTDLQVAEALLKGPAGEILQSLNLGAQELVAGWKTNPKIVRLEDSSELVQGTAGVDQVRYGLNWADVVLENRGETSWTGTSLIDGDMADFRDVERLHLKDVSLALDTHKGGAASNLKGLITVTLGAEALADKVLVGEGLAALDAGMSLQALGEVAMRYVQSQQGREFTAQETVQWLWTRAVYREGSQEELRPYVEQLQSGQVSTGDLVKAALEHEITGGPMVAYKPLLYIA